MTAVSISIRADIKAISKKLSAFAYQQLPYAQAQAVTALAKLVQQDEVKNLSAIFKNPSPFTLRSVRTIPARKNDPTATVFVMDKTAEYLDPYERGGVHKLSGKALLNPKDIALNQYNQLPRRVLARLKARSDIFVGPVKTKNGIVNGVWQRPFIRADQRIRGKSKVARGSNTTGKLKLLIRFGDALPVRKHLGYHARAALVVNANFNKEMGRALAKAVATAR